MLASRCVFLSTLVLIAAGNEMAPLVTKAFTKYPTYSGALSVVGTVSIGFEEPSKLVLFFNLKGVDEACTSTFNSSKKANSCGIHVHEGKTCESAGGHYWSKNYSNSDPWASVRYTYDGAKKSAIGENVHVSTGASLKDTVGRTIVVHDQNGTRIACALMEQLSPAGDLLTVSSFSSYPGYAGSLVVQGSSKAFQVKGDESSYVLTYVLKGVDTQCGVKNISGVANACGIHIHEGSDCKNKDTIGGHLYDKVNGSTDPWLPIMYTATKGAANGATIAVKVGLPFGTISNKAVVIHDAGGKRIACGELKKTDNAVVISSTTGVRPLSLGFAVVFVLAIAQ
eukprot:TRINITY_DN11327_c0_g2_i1.p1 TRINITY_DN11327_c0_g2~~TRINITY_DN11327_c0_g2_i1.p1  ORF type:complete len:360 (-),score=41.20 TRINITY_DN11327_c0_g2_i1:314-1330(-)